MTTVIVTGVEVVHAAVRYHRRLGRYVVEVVGEGVTVEFVLTGEQARRLLAEFRQQEHKVREDHSDSGGPARVGKERAR